MAYTTACTTVQAVTRPRHRERAISSAGPYLQNALPTDINT